LVLENLVQVIISGFLEVGLVKAEILSGNDIAKEKILKISKNSAYQSLEGKGESIIRANIIFLSVKPQDILEVFDEIRNFVKIKAIIIQLFRE
jgi:pyrroline-5-carboxylate reductase